MSIMVLVADSSRAKLYLAANSTSPLIEVEDFVMPEGRMHEGDLVADKPGTDSGGGVQGRHPLGNKTSATEAAQESFVRMLVKHLKQEQDKSAFGRLVLMAPPAFLGMLRNHMDENLKKCVVDEVNKNLVQSSVDDLRQHISVMR